MSAEFSAHEAADGLTGLPQDELIRFGREFGLDLPDDAARGEALRLVRERQTLLDRSDRAVLLEIVQWGRVPVRQSAGAADLGRAVATIGKMKFDGLSDSAVRLLAQLRNVEIRADDDRAKIERRLKRAERIGAWFKRHSRQAVAKWVDRYIDAGQPADNAYRFLPEDGASTGGAPPRREDIVDRGIMTGLASRLRGAADDYVRAKLDEIEQRIDRKLDEIDQRLGEWRDREVANRLRIIRITLVASVIVALLSLVYKYVAGHVETPSSKPAALVNGTGQEPCTNDFPHDLTTSSNSRTRSRVIPGMTTSALSTCCWGSCVMEPEKPYVF